MVRIEGTELPGRNCGPGPDFPDGHRNIHVAIQGRKGQHDLYGTVPGDLPTVVWELNSVVASPPPDVDLKGPQIQGAVGKRFIYLTWGVMDDTDQFTMFRRAKLWLDAVPIVTMELAYSRGVLVGRLGLSDDKGWPLCASVRPPRIEWSAEYGKRQS